MTLWISCLLLAVELLAAAAAQPEGCPDSCFCLDDTATCQVTGVSPKTLPIGVTDLRLEIRGYANIHMAYLPSSYANALTKLTFRKIDGGSIFISARFLTRENLPALEELVVSGCSKFGTNFTTLDEKLLTSDDVVRLTRLTVAECGLKVVHSGVFRLQDRLTHLNLSNNELTSITSEVFQGLTALQVLDLSGNRISLINARTFSTLHKLVELYLQNNRLSLLPKEFLAQLSLRSLDLSHNPIEVVDHWAAHQAEVTSLRLDNTRIKMTDKFLQIFFEPLKSSLKYLSLDNIRGDVKLESENVFDGFRFDRLSIRNSSLSKVRFLWNLDAKELYLDNNKFSTLEPMKCSKLKPTTKLSFSNNQLTEIPSRFFKCFPHLEELNLSANLIRDVHPGAFSAKRLRRINLTDNRLQRLAHDTVQNNSSRAHIQLYDNPLHCNCELRWLRLKVDLVEGRCKTPKILDLSAVNLTAMTCANPDARVTEPKVTSYRGQSALLTCMVRGDPAPTVFWRYPDETTLQFKPPNLALRQRNVTLRIERVNFQHVGKFLCTAIGAPQSENAVALTTLDLRQQSFSWPTVMDIVLTVTVASIVLVVIIGFVLWACLSKEKHSSTTISTSSAASSVKRMGGGILLCPHEEVML